MANNAAQWRIRKWYPTLTESQFEKLRIYDLELMRAALTIDLIPPATMSEADLIHFGDIISGFETISSEVASGTEVWDLGSGNGFPGVVIGILRPDINVVCVETDKRRVDFLTEVCRRVTATNIGIRNQKVEEIPSKSVFCAVTRGFASLDVTLQYAAEPCAQGAALYHFKGLDWRAEIAELTDKANTAWSTGMLKAYHWPEVTEGPSRGIIRSIRL